MPTYDVECAKCGFEGIEIMAIAALEAWDQAAKCPQCAGDHTAFRRVIKQAPVSYSGAKAVARSKASHKISMQERFVSSGEKDDMKHRSAKHHNPDKVAAARESVRKGEFEGF